MSETLEARIVEAIENEATTFTAICFMVGNSLYPFRQVDRALQKLRKRGRIVFDSKKGWRIVL